MTTKDKILDIAMNLNRVGNWAADDYLGKKERIKTFLENTSGYLNDLKDVSYPEEFLDTIVRFKKEYKELEHEGLTGPKDSLYWAEKMMTWGNILTHRAYLLE
jgi:hypothetical protein